MKNVGQYMYVAREEIVKIEPVTFKVVLYGAYNAMGMIGPEINGIAILEESPRRVVHVDGIAAELYGWYIGYGGPSGKQTTEFDRICALPDADFLLFIQNHPRSRGHIAIVTETRQ